MGWQRWAFCPRTVYPAVAQGSPSKLERTKGIPPKPPNYAPPHVFRRHDIILCTKGAGAGVNMDVCVNVCVKGTSPSVTALSWNIRFVPNFILSYFLDPLSDSNYVTAFCISKPFLLRYLNPPHTCAHNGANWCFSLLFLLLLWHEFDVKSLFKKMNCF